MVSTTYLLLATLIVVRFRPVVCFVRTPMPHVTGRTLVVLHRDKGVSSLLSEETIGRLQKDYRDLRDAFHFQANYFRQLAGAGCEDDDEITEDSLEKMAYLAHLKRFQLEQLAVEAAEEHEHAMDELQKVNAEMERLHDAKLMQDFESELAQSEEAQAEAKQQRALRLVQLIEDSEDDLRAALEELRQANNVDQLSQMERRIHQSKLHSFKVHLINHDPFKGSVAF